MAIAPILILLIISLLVSGVVAQGRLGDTNNAAGVNSSISNAGGQGDLATNAQASVDNIIGQPQTSVLEANPQPTATPKPAPLPQMAYVAPDKVGMAPAPLKKIDSAMQRSIDDALFPGAVVLVARKSAIVKHDAYGYAALYSAPGQKLANPTLAAKDTIYDLASLSKLFTTTAVMKLVERGTIDLDAPVVKYIPEFGANDKSTVTVRQLLSHTAGLPDGVQIFKHGSTREERLQMVFDAKLKYPPGTTRLYSDVGFETLGALVERISGMRLDEFVTREIISPLQMNDTMYNPPAELISRIAATETNQPATGRQMIRGQVHDPDAFSLDGVSGNAGVFSTAHDLAIFGQMILNGGQYAGVRMLQEKTVNSMLELQSKSPDGEVSTLGWDQNQRWYMGNLASKQAVGHTGYTGTSIVIDRASKTVIILLTNRVHPEDKAGINAARVSVANAVAEALK